MPHTVLDWLIERYPTAKRQTLKRMVQAGRVSVNGHPATMLKQEIARTDRVSADEHSHAERAPAAPPPQLRIVYEDQDLLVLDKPAGLLTSTVPGERRPTLWALAKDYVAARDPRARVGLIHRLDRDAAGLLIFSKTDLAYQSLKSQFFHHTVRREYAALVHGQPRPPSGRIESQLVERADGSVHSTRQIGKGQLAITDYETIEAKGKTTLLRVILQTGRKHQIRVHLSERGWPILGDKMYGREDDPAPRLMLAAVKLTIQHPRDGRELVFTGPGIDFPPSRHDAK